jgi:hypothetical protein
MRIRMALAAVIAAVVLSPPAASAAPPVPDTLEWTGHSSCGNVTFDYSFVYESGGYHRLAMAGTILNCLTVKPGDFFVLASYPAGANATPHFLLSYDQGPTTYFEGSLRMLTPMPVCLANWYNQRMACLSVTASGSTWTAAPLSIVDPSVSAPIVATLRPGDPKCATCWD